MSEANFRFFPRKKHSLRIWRAPFRHFASEDYEISKKHGSTCRIPNCGRPFEEVGYGGKCSKCNRHMCRNCVREAVFRDKYGVERRIRCCLYCKQELDTEHNIYFIRTASLASKIFGWYGFLILCGFALLIGFLGRAVRVDFFIRLQEELIAILFMFFIIGLVLYHAIREDAKQNRIPTTSQGAQQEVVKTNGKG